MRVERQLGQRKQMGKEEAQFLHLADGVIPTIDDCRSSRMQEAAWCPAAVRTVVGG